MNTDDIDFTLTDDPPIYAKSIIYIGNIPARWLLHRYRTHPNLVDFVKEIVECHGLAPHGVIASANWERRTTLFGVSWARSEANPDHYRRLDALRADGRLPEWVMSKRWQRFPDDTVDYRR